MLISSVETALVKVTNDLLPVGDSRLITILILLDLNAAFDTIPHHILLYRSASIGINNMAQVSLIPLQLFTVCATAYTDHNPVD